MELNFKPISEQVTLSRSSGKSLGTDLRLPPLPGSYKVQKVLGQIGLSPLLMVLDVSNVKKTVDKSILVLFGFLIT